MIHLVSTYDEFGLWRFVEMKTKLPTNCGIENDQHLILLISRKYLLLPGNNIIPGTSTRYSVLVPTQVLTSTFKRRLAPNSSSACMTRCNTNYLPTVARYIANHMHMFIHSSSSCSYSSEVTTGRLIDDVDDLNGPGTAFPSCSM